MQTAESTTSFTKRNIKTQVIMVMIINDNDNDNQDDNGAVCDGVVLGQG